MHRLKCLVRSLYLLVYHRNLAALAIYDKESPLQHAEDVNAEHTECALKVVVLISNFSRASTIQRTAVLGETTLCGAT